MSAAETPTWSTYHGNDIVRLAVGDEGFTLGLTAEGVIFFLQPDSTFISGWARDDHDVVGFNIAEAGYRAAATYEDGYTTLFDHDSEDGQQLWNLRIEELSLTSLGLSADGRFTSVANSPVEKREEEDEESYERKRPSVVWMFDEDGEQLWSKELESVIYATDVDNTGWVVAGGGPYGTDDRPRGKEAVYLYDDEGDLVWDYNLDGTVEKVAFLGGESNYIGVYTADNSLIMFDRWGGFLWEREVGEEVIFSRDYLLEIGPDEILLLDFEGESVLEKEREDYNQFAISNAGDVAAVTDNRAVIWNRQGEELLSYETDLRIDGMALSGNGSYFVLGMDRVSMFRLD